MAHGGKGIFGIVKNGHGVHFWQDFWVPEVGALSDHSLMVLTYMDRRLSVKDYSVNGDWNWPLLYTVLPLPICAKLASIRVPSGDMEDYPVWFFAADGNFSIKFACEVLHDIEVPVPAEFNFQSIWKLKTPPQINTFLWKVAHHRLMTNLERNERGIAASDVCPWCNLHPESIMHVLRDCEVTLEMWE